MTELNDWLSIDKTSGEGNDTITLYADYNEAEDIRNASLIIKTDTKNVLLNLTQSGIIKGDFMFSTKELITSEWRGNTKTFEICTTFEDLYFEGIPDWVNISMERNGYINTYTLTFEPNNTSSKRFALLTPRTTNWSYNFTDFQMRPLTLAQGIKSEENKAIFYIGTAGSANTTDVVANRLEYIGYSGLEIRSILYSNRIVNVPDNLFNSYESSSWNGWVSSVSLPPSVKTIGTKAFFMESITIDWCDGINTIYDYAFGGGYTVNGNVNGKVPSYLYDMPPLKLPSSLTYIGEGAFEQLDSYKKVIIPEGVTFLGKGAFISGKFSEINIPEGVTNLDLTFANCKKLKSIQIPSTVTNLEMTFSGCTSLTSVIIPEGVKTIGGSTFRDCTSLKTISLPDSVTTIEGTAFYNTPITSLTIPENVTTFYQNAITNCTSLDSITCKRRTPPSIVYTYNILFENIKPNGILYYPSGSDYSKWLREDFLGKYGWTGVPY